MFDVEEEREPHSVEYEKHKKRREQRRKQKMQLLEVNYVNDMLSRSSELKEIEESLTLFDASPSIPKVNGTRRKLRSKKSSTAGESPAETLECTEAELVNGLQKIKRCRWKSRMKKNNSEIDGEIPNEPISANEKNMDTLALNIENLMLESLNARGCHGNSSSQSDMLSRSSELQEIEESLTSFDASPSISKENGTRRKLRTRKSSTAGESSAETLEYTETEVVNGLQKIKRCRWKSRMKKNHSEIDGEILNEPLSSNEKNMDTLALNIEKLMLESLNARGCHGNSSSQAKMKPLLTENVTGNGIKYFETKSKLSRDQKAMTPSDNYQEKRKKKSNSKEIMKNDSKKTPNKTPQKPKEKFGVYMPLEEVKTGLDSGELILGNIRINPKDHKLSYVNNPVKDQQDILLISIRDRNCALEGDRVVIQLKPESEWKTSNQKTAQVVCILEKVHPRTTVGILKLMQDKNKRFALFHPRDARVPRIKIPFTEWPVNFYNQAEEYEKVLLLAQITKWDEPHYAIGSIVQNIGFSGNIINETRAILEENCLDCTPYGDDMKQYYPATGDIDPKEYEYRMDLRKECIFTIDPLTARDLDDAVSCKSLPNGNYEIGVHISDVSYYLKENTPLEEKVSQKATSIYMVESVYHMLPRELCMMCSLLPGEDKLAFSVFWEMTPEGKVINHKFSRTVINSCVQLAYEHAQKMIEDPTTQAELPEIHNGFKAEDLSRIVNILHKIAVNLRNSRYQSGALRIDQPKVSFTLNPANGLPVSYQLYENKECHRLIEEFMLLANITVATRLRNDYPDIAFLRSHCPPHDYMMNNLKATLEKVGIHLDVSTAGGLQQSLWKYSTDCPLSQARMLVLNLMCAKPMARATYFCANNSNDTEDYWHYALSVPLYTHFTSPIRRYADIVVHRQLAGSLGYTEKPNWSSDFVREAAANCNKQKYNAKRAGEQSIELYLITYIDEHQPVIEKAVVMEVRDSSFDAIVISNGITVRLYLNNLEEGVSYQFLEEENKNDSKEEGKKLLNLQIEWPAQDNKPSVTQIIAMFSIITISLTKKDKVLKLQTTLIRPEV